MLRRPIAVALLMGAAGLVSAQDWTRHFRLGAVVGLNLQASFKMSGEFQVSGGDLAGPPGVPGVDHLYDDGYVRVDNTGNAQGYTSFWGYQDPEQYNAGDHTLTLRSSSSFNLTSSARPDSDAYVGLDVVYGGRLTKSGDALVNWELGFMWMPIFVKDTTELSTTFEQTVHVFDTGDIMMPDAPYHGGPSGIGPTIRDVASLGPPETRLGTITGSRKLDVTLYNFRLGPSMHWEVNRWFAFSVGGGAALGLAACKYSYDERIRVSNGGEASNRGSFNRTELVYGAYVDVTLLFHTVENADIFIGAQFMTLNNVGAGGEGRQASLDLGAGAYLSAGINWPF